MKNKNFYKVSEIANELGVTSATIYNWHKKGLINLTKKGSSYFMTHDEKQKLLEDNK